MKPHGALKVLIALLPAVVFTQNWAWITHNRMIGIAFLLLWAGMIFYLYDLKEKNAVYFKAFRATEIALFLLPISAFILMAVLGSQSLTAAGDDAAAQAGTAIGLAIAGPIVLVVSFIIGISGGIVMHLLSRRYERKLSGHEEGGRQDMLHQHRVAAIVGIMVLLLMVSIGGSPDAAQVADGSGGSGNAPAQGQANGASTEADVPQGPAPIEIIKTSVTKDIIDTPVAAVQVKNITDKEIDGIKLTIKAFNNFGEPVNGFLSDNTYNGIAQEIIAPGATENLQWTLYNYDGTTKVEAVPFHVHFTDGSSWGGE